MFSSFYGKHFLWENMEEAQKRQQLKATETVDESGKKKFVCSTWILIEIFEYFYDFY